MGLLLLTSNSCRILPTLFQANWKVFLNNSVKFGIKYFLFFFSFFSLYLTRLSLLEYGANNSKVVGSIRI